VEENRAALLSEQMHHALNLMRVEIELLQTRLNHQDEMNNQRLKFLESRSEDHEQRLRTATDGVTQFKVWSSLASGSSFIASIAALFKAFLGG
jgi:hypothetical protein